MEFGIGLKWQAIFVEVESILGVELGLGCLIDQGVDFRIMKKLGKAILVAVFEVVGSPDDERSGDMIELLKHALVVDRDHLGG